ncbi:hypothetical protein ALC53_13391 [Atta colombica]|uniref:Uncharacterized protein n=1 Tax=Atta colombica TaxID=520822 RepID=A0A195AWM0_9HYME|nr:hypothetical protein ALC53_13391 [Atta colombica]
MCMHLALPPARSIAPPSLPPSSQTQLRGRSARLSGQSRSLPLSIPPILAEATSAPPLCATATPNPDGGKGGAQAPRAEDDDGGRHRSSGRGLYGERGKGMKQGGAGGDTGLPLPVRSPRDGTAKRIVERTMREGREKERVQRDLAGRGEVPSKRRRVVPAPRTYSTNLRIHEDERTSELGSPGERASCFLLRELFFCPVVEAQEKAR